MERLRHHREYFGYGGSFKDGCWLLRLGACIFLAVLAVTIGAMVSTPPARAHSSILLHARGSAHILSTRLSTGTSLFSAHAGTASHSASMTTAVRRSSAAGGSCHPPDTSVVVQSGETLGGIAMAHGTTWDVLAAYNHIPNANLIFPSQTVCIPAQTSHTAQAAPVVDTPVITLSNSGVSTPQVGHANPFTYGQCTWWANQRYFQLHGVYVPWATQADAWEWTARARDFGWQVSTSPQVGDIVDLQPWTQGAYGLGHVAVVERILGNGDVIASNMNWGATPGMVVNVEFTPGTGVTFIRL